MKTLAGFVACSLLAAAVPAAAQAPAEPEQPKKAAPSLNLKLDERPAAAPRITFEPRDAGARNPGSGLPALGGTPTRSFDAPTGFGGRSDSGSSPYPKDTNPGR